MKYLIPLLLISLSCMGQPEDQEAMKDKIEAYRARFLTEKLDLTPKEAQLFWPVYNEYREKKEALRDERPGYFGKKDKAEAIIKEMDEKEMERTLKKEMERQKKLVMLQEEYYEEFKKVISVKKIALLYHAEFQFQRKLMEEVVRKRERRKKSIERND